MFLHLLNIKGTHFSYDGIRRVSTMRWPAANLRFFDKEDYTPFQALHKSIVYTYFCELPGFVRWIFASAIIPVLALIGLLFVRKRHAPFALLAALLLFRLAWVAALTPAAYFKYVTPIWFGGWMLLIFFLLERNRTIYSATTFQIVAAGNERSNFVAMIRTMLRDVWLTRRWAK